MNTVSKSKRKVPDRRGSRKGIPNKATKALKDMILGALDAKGGQAWLEQQMDEQPVAFMTLIGKVLPTTLETTPQGIKMVLTWETPKT